MPPQRVVGIAVLVGWAGKRAKSENRAKPASSLVLQAGFPHGGFGPETKMTLLSFLGVYRKTHRPYNPVIASGSGANRRQELRQVTEIEKKFSKSATEKRVLTRKDVSTITTATLTTPSTLCSHCSVISERADDLPGNRMRAYVSEGTLEATASTDVLAREGSEVSSLTL